MKEILISIIVLGATGLAFSIILSLLDKKLKVKENPLTEKILSVLPGLNCGACGFSGCQAYAQAIIKDKKLFAGCLPGGEKTNQNLSEILEITGAISVNKTTIVCRCGAEKGEKKNTAVYHGPQTCKAANLVGGNIDCGYGCLALGDCVKICPTRAISLKNEKIYVDLQKCISCGKCVTSCPRNLLELIPTVKTFGVYHVACNNPESGRGVRTVCAKGCIACGICVKISNSPFYLKDNLSYLNYDRIDTVEALEDAKNKCPTKCIEKKSL